MEFKVSKITDIICAGCGGTTRVVPNSKYVYKTEDLTCNCPKDGELFGRADIKELLDKPIDNTPKPKSNAKTEQARKRTSSAQAKMWEPEPENVFEEETMKREEVAEYLKGLKWQELMNSAKNNGVKKDPSTTREMLEEEILNAVFGDSDVVAVVDSSE